MHQPFELHQQEPCGCEDSLFREIDDSFFTEADASADLGVEELQRLQQVALVRIHLYVTGRVHDELGALVDELEEIMKGAEVDDSVPPEAMPAIFQQADRLWRNHYDRTIRLFYRARYQAVLIAFASLAKAHDYFRQLCRDNIQNESLRWHPGMTLFQEASPIFIPPTVPEELSPEQIFNPDVGGMMDAAANRAFGDNLRLSDRVWRLDRDGESVVRNAINRTIGTGESAFAAARALETELGVGRDCPRWTSTRLYQLTPAERAITSRGLLRSGTPCATGGVSYRMLRLFRNEIQHIHHEVARRNMELQPWVQAERIRLSPQHPRPDICDPIAAGGPYEIGFYPLPIHVQCLCWALAVMMPDSEFISRMRGWLDGVEWAEMDAYEQYVRDNFPLGVQN